MAEEISPDYHDRESIFIGVLKGIFVFMADLVRCLSIPVRCEFVRAQSYGDSFTSTGG